VTLCLCRSSFAKSTDPIARTTSRANALFVCPKVTRKGEDVYKVEVQVIGEEGQWVGNAMRYATEAEAEAAARDLAGRWTAVTEWRVVPMEVDK